MDNLQIKEQIERNNKEIESIMTPELFVLNERVRDLIEENFELQSQCTHCFEDGICIYCGKEEK